MLCLNEALNASDLVGHDDWIAVLELLPLLCLVVMTAAVGLGMSVLTTEHVIALALESQQPNLLVAGPATRLVSLVRTWFV